MEEVEVVDVAASQIGKMVGSPVAEAEEEDFLIGETIDSQEVVVVVVEEAVEITTTTGEAFCNTLSEPSTD
ncbi:UNVERIFIED_CONTAM: hypothetical protein Slati_4116400 [Sesamum latifolium]|uniref:Uncharacterized protein n=1 Tax=Sesamum latifolium TaxID=2727402 RepID=A0AAW2T826_9LAMI